MDEGRLLRPPLIHNQIYIPKIPKVCIRTYQQHIRNIKVQRRTCISLKKPGTSQSPGLEAPKSAGRKTITWVL